ncbi:Gfo/Idh/MocA family protein [Actinomarinicola tropica]|uniref:Gfo/Idh/MocA family oxidoreductase n=1 Tax=Actinomarinicola tropica TaxID=2789776 RepID=A0A5Q2RNK0_9ACTN|nr:Gfo/Idh/MocA family oxidoreductase [Actinomarinicola tropica]QGG95996.1 gfo/Idh/MocA family oxidoreductase [Actinomarinicola tropica]
MTAPRPSGRLRAGVIGCGAIAHEHLRHLRGSSRAELVAVCDRSNATARFAQETYGAPHRHLDHRAMLEAENLDVVHVLTPPQTHPDIVRDALDAGAHVLCEKPLAPTCAVTEDLLAHAAAADRRLVESQNLRWNDPVLAVDELIRAGRLGAVRDVEVSLTLDLTAGPFGDLNLSGPGVALPGGAVHDFLPHLSYLFLLLAGSSAVDDVVGHLVNASGNARVGFDQLDALVRAGEVRGRLRVASDVAPDTFRLRVLGTEASVETDLYNPYLRFEGRTTGVGGPIAQLRSGTRIAGASVANLLDKVRQHSTYHGLPRMIDALHDALRDGTEPPIAPEQIVATARLTDQLVALAEVGR